MVLEVLVLMLDYYINLESTSHQNCFACETISGI